MDFSEFLFPINNESFFQLYWEKQFLHISNDNKLKTERICTTNEIDAYFASKNIIPENIRLVQNGINIASDKFSDKVTTLNGNTFLRVNIAKILKEFNAGATIIINSAQDVFQNLTTLCRSFEETFKCPFQANIYITPPNSQGFSKHYDTHDIFLIQIKGPKTWYLYNSKIALATYLESIGTDHTKLSEININTGDILYLPRGIIHEAFTSEKSTIHINLVPKQKFGFSLIEKLSKLAEVDDVFFRQSIPHSFSSELEQQTYIEQFQKKLVGLISKNQIETLLKTSFVNFVDNQNLNIQGRFNDAISIERLGINSKIKRREGIHYLEKKVLGYTVIHFGGNMIKIPDFIDKSIFFNSQIFEVNDIKGLISKEGKIVLVREFIEQGFLEII
jgi:ribosomal protein L16 Arg81 hydroxylase